MSLILRRTLSTPSISPSTLSSHSTLPLAVRRRRTLRPPHPSTTPSPLSDPDVLLPPDSNTFVLGRTPKTLPYKLELEFQNRRMKGQFKGDETSARRAFLKGQIAWRSRIRGVKEIKGEYWKGLFEGKDEDDEFPEIGKKTKNTEFPSTDKFLQLQGSVFKPDSLSQSTNTESEVNAAFDSEGIDELEEEGIDTKGPMSEVEEEEFSEWKTEDEHQSSIGEEGAVEIEEKESIDTLQAHRIYLPNIQIRMMRNHTPSGEPYDPFIATFRVPPSMTKTDLRSYLMAVYNLPVTFIRTDLYSAPVTRIWPGKIVKGGGSKKNYKRAIVGLLEPFHYPDDIEELYAQGESAGVGDKWAKGREKWLDENVFKSDSDRYREKVTFKMHKRTKWRNSSDNVGNVQRSISKTRDQREEAVSQAAEQLRLSPPSTDLSVPSST
ncbi:hypothetical protein M231_01833 [Tremella mesenterica]|uniref:Large ribosomal subunit protein uL23m n=1 Tax=Tremella mesenterica TaxID=5217 RepID=A0A4Q1BSH7_TREME|nr:hypothetical protein M231_01833 [Tremella mesenterica]